MSTPESFPATGRPAIGRLHRRPPRHHQELALLAAYKEEGPEKASRGTFDADLLEYVNGAQTASG